jgi:peptide chain release factor 2
MNPSDLKNIETVKSSIKHIKSFVDFDKSVEKLDSMLKQTELQDFWDNQESASRIMRDIDALRDAIRPAKELSTELDEVIGLMELAEEDSDEALACELSRSLENLARKAEVAQIEILLGGKDDCSNCFVEINAGAGGTEAQDWAEMLARMYSRWAERKRYKLEITDKNDGEEAGVKSIVLNIKGLRAYGWLKKESGIHRLVRISPFDSNSRRHTSFASVLVTPDVDDLIEVEINESDLRIDTYRASGAGGQHVNKTDSAVRITHIPSGIVAQSQTDRSQHRNRDIAMNMLRAKLYAMKLKERDSAILASQNKTEISWGNQIRSYVLQPYQMVKDNRTGVEKGDAFAVLDGEIDEFLESAVSQLYVGANGA